jgi:glyoxylase-like metal-dependent hydrolase (beta-lactamase superfamily II)
MLEIEPYGKDVICIKTGSGQDGEVIMWSYSYMIGDALFDAGCANAREEFAEALREYHVESLYISHTHEDHVGACSTLEDDVTIYATPAATEELQNPIDLSEFFRTVWGQPDPVSKIEPMPDEFDIGDFHFDVIPLPGHKADMVGFYEPNRKWLFSADAVPVPTRKKIAMPDENIAELIVTLERIYEMDLEILFDSHRGPIENPKEHIKARIDFLKEFRSQARALHAEGKSIEEIQESLELDGPWYLELTKDRFGIHFMISSIIHDEPSSNV